MIGFCCNKGVGMVVYNCCVKRNDFVVKERDL